MPEYTEIHPAICFNVTLGDSVISVMIPGHWLTLCGTLASVTKGKYGDKFNLNILIIISYLAISDRSTWSPHLPVVEVAPHH